MAVPVPQQTELVRSGRQEDVAEVIRLATTKQRVSLISGAGLGVKCRCN